jgi:serine/threonine protein kinase
MPGEVVFGRYTLLNKLAVGGMAEIFVAQVRGEAGFRKTCVIKRVLPHLALREGFREMFLDEAHIAARLNHPGIVQIFDLGREGDDFYIAMEYLAGENLGDILRQSNKLGRQVPLEVAARIIAAAAEAVHYAHEVKDSSGKPLGIVHRDISPSNLFVTYQGTVKLLDFGIARAEQRAQETLGGHVKGKLAYMAPEQATHDAVDRRADVWSLGVCLHELLTGRRLFSQDSLGATAEALVRMSIPRCASARPEVPEELDDIVQAALVRDPGLRLPTAEALRAALERFLAARSYVPSSSMLGDFVRQLFGTQRAQERMLLGSTPLASELAQQGPVEGTPLLSLMSSPLAHEARTVLAGPEDMVARSAPRRRRGGLLFGGMGVAVVAGLLGWGLLSRDRIVAPAPSTSPAPVAPPLAKAPAPPPATAPPEPAPKVEPPVAPRHARDPGWLSVDSNVAARAWIDGTLLGPLPVQRARVPAGEHRLRIDNPALGLSRTTRVRVPAGEAVEHHAPVELGTLNVTVDPWADVYLDGFRLGQTPLAGRPVAAAAHQLRLVGPNGEKSLQIQIKPTETLVVREHLL